MTLHRQTLDRSAQQHDAPESADQAEAEQASMPQLGLLAQLQRRADSSLRARMVSSLQRTHGNRFTQRVLAQRQPAAQLLGQASGPILGAANHALAGALAQRQPIQREGNVERPINSIDLSGIAPNANKVKEAAAKILDVATTVRKDGEHWYGDEKDKINMAANLTDMASKMTSAASAMENMTRGLDGGKLEGPAEVLDKATKLLRAVDFLGSIDPNHPSLVAFKNDPGDFTKASAWATQIGESFSKASELIPDSIPGLPGFIPQYFKGLLSAPKNYIQVFIALQQDRINKIDSETGGSSADQRVSEGDRSVWEGPLSGVFYGAFFVQPPGLQGFMTANRHIGGVDLWKTSLSYGKALILGAVQGVGDENKRELWSNYINGS
jgi:hypothetical protein